MKNWLGLVGAITFITLPTNATLSCKSQESYSPKKELGQTINRVEKVIEDEKNNFYHFIYYINDPRKPIEKLEAKLDDAKRIYYDRNSKDTDYKQANSSLKRELKEYYDQGYNKVYDELKALIIKVEEEIIKEKGPKNPKNIEDLDNALIKSKEALNDENSNTVKLSFCIQMLEWSYKAWRENKSDEKLF